MTKPALHFFRFPAGQGGGVSDPTPQEKARDALYQRIAAQEPDSPEAVEKLANAYAQVTYGPQGGSMDYDYESDALTTQHPGEQRERPAGFG